MKCESCGKPMERVEVIHWITQGDGHVSYMGYGRGFICRTKRCEKQGRVVHDRPLGIQSTGTWP